MKKVLLYIAILFVAIYSLYTYGTKSLYVDVPMAAWAGGLAGWWIDTEKTKTKFTGIYRRPDCPLLYQAIFGGINGALCACVCD